MKKLSLWFLAVFIMFAVVGFSASPNWAYPNPFQAFAAQEQALSTPTVNTASDHSPPQSAIIDWNAPKFDPHVGVAASPPASSASSFSELSVGACYPNPFALHVTHEKPNVSFSLVIGDCYPQTYSQYKQEVRFVYIGNKVLIIDVTTPMINMIGGGADTSAYALHGGPRPTYREDTGGRDVPYVYLGKLPADGGYAESSHTMNANLSA